MKICAEMFDARTARYCVLVHGGAGAWSERHRDEGVRGCERAVLGASAALERGASALDAVELAVRLLEDDPTFNAGTGGNLTRDGTLELDASIMDGRELRAGAVTGLGAFRNPVSVARGALEEGRHVLYAARGADALALRRGHQAVEPGALITERARERLAKAIAAEPPPEGDTVGAVAFDSLGRFAAATSTGGITGKLPGRVGDSPIPGAGCYADDELGAASSTGNGEGILRAVLAFRVLSNAERAGLRESARDGLGFMLSRTGARGGMVAISARRELCWARSTEAMPWAFMLHGGGATSGA
jgi:beta-aspartyl-peptidase (threonine type)